jgi:flagellar motor switch protein FliN/FliY
MTDEGETGGSPRNVNMLLDVELEITVELGKKNMLISEILKIGKGSIIELQKSAGEPLDILVNGRKLAEGEVVVVDDHFGIRITQLASPRDRLKSLG